MPPPWMPWKWCMGGGLMAFSKNTFECSVCFEEGVCKCYETKHRYCPNCGAKMDGGNEDG